MRNRILTIVALFTVAAVVLAAEAQQREPGDAPSAELQRILDKLDEANQNVEDLTARVRYSREIPLLDELEECDGSLAFKKPNLIHLKLGKPRNEEFYTDGEQWWIVSHNDKLVEIYPAAESADAAAEASFLTIGYGQSSEKLLEQYEVTLEGTKKEGKPAVTYYRLKFVPSDKEAPVHFCAIEAHIGDDLWLPRTLVLYESDGEIIHTFRLEKIKLNPGLKAESFAYEPPRGYDVLEPTQP